MLNFLKKEEGVVEGIVKSIQPYGVFINTDCGRSGMIHQSNIEWNSIKHKTSIFGIGDRLKAKIIGEKCGKGLELSIKHLTFNPNLQYKVGDVFEGFVNGVTDDSLVLRQPSGATGFVHHDYISHDDRNPQLLDAFAVGDLIKTQVISSCSENALQLSIKHLEPCLYEEYAKSLEHFQEIEGKISCYRHGMLSFQVAPRVWFSIPGSQTSGLVIGDHVTGKFDGVMKKSRCLKLLVATKKPFEWRQKHTVNYSFI
jgi:ribosomal protein S1